MSEPQDRVDHYVATIHIDVQAVNRYGNVLNDETHIAITRTIQGKELAPIVDRFEKA